MGWGRCIAHATRLGRTVAIKFTRSDLDEATGARAQFEREGRAIAALNHRRICSVYDVGSFVSQNYLVMECLDGETLEHRLRRGRLPLDELFTVAIAVAEGLVAAHRSGIVHRDLKPANVMQSAIRGEVLEVLGEATQKAAISARSATKRAAASKMTPKGLPSISPAFRAA